MLPVHRHSGDHVFGLSWPSPIRAVGVRPAMALVRQNRFGSSDRYIGVSVGRVASVERMGFELATVSARGDKIIVCHLQPLITVGRFGAHAPGDPGTSTTRTVSSTSMKFVGLIAAPAVPARSGAPVERGWCWARTDPGPRRTIGPTSPVRRDIVLKWRFPAVTSVN